MLVYISVVWFLFLRLTSGVLTTSFVVTTNINGAVVTQASVYEAATAVTTVITTTNDLGISVTLTETTTPTSAVAATTATTGTATGVTTGTTTGVTTGTATTTGVTTGTATTATSATTTGVTTGTAVTTTPATTTGKSLITSVITSTDALGATHLSTETITASSSVTSSLSSSSSITSATTVNTDDNTRPDPSTDYTQPPSTPVTTLSIQSFVTITEGTTATYTTEMAATSMWVTVVRQGNTIVMKTTFAQRFASLYTSVAVPSSGSVGLGTISGTVGVARTSLEVTIKDGSGPILQSTYGYSFLASLFAFFMWFL